MREDIHTKQKKEQAKELIPIVNDAEILANKFKLQPGEIKFWVVDSEEMAQAVSYQGYPKRYPHWRWGMMYKQIKNQIILGSKFYEIVVHSNPAHAYLQESNSRAIQKLVITHVLAHGDIFRNNKYFKKMIDSKDSARILEENSQKIEEIIEQEDINREEVEQWIDYILSLEFNIDQYNYVKKEIDSEEKQVTKEEIKEKLKDSGFSDEIIESEIDINSIIEEEKDEIKLDDEKDLLWFLYKNGKTYDEKSERAIDMKEWQKEIIKLLRDEFYLFAPIQLTKTLNEGWAVFWHSMMMMNEQFASENEYIEYAKKTSEILRGGGQSHNPYKVGYELWKYAENKYNRNHILSQLLQVKDITPKTFYDINFDEIANLLEPSDIVLNPQNYTIQEITSQIPKENIDMEYVKKAKNNEFNYKKQPWKLFTYKGLAKRNYSLLRKENKSFLKETPKHIIESKYRYLKEKEKYDSIENALKNINYTYAWDKMRIDREISNDTTFFEKHLSPEFIQRNNYFTYEYNFRKNRFEVESTKFEDVKNKLQLEVTNFGKPKIKAVDFNYKNEGRLLLEHEYNEIPLNIPKAADTLKQIFNLWGRPVHLKTIVLDRNSGRRDPMKGLELEYNPQNEEKLRQKVLTKKEYEHLLNN